MSTVALKLRIGGATILAGVIGKIYYDARYGQPSKEVVEARRVIIRAMKRSAAKFGVLLGGVICAIYAFRSTSLTLDLRTPPCCWRIITTK